MKPSSASMPSGPGVSATAAAAVAAAAGSVACGSATVGDGSKRLLRTSSVAPGLGASARGDGGSPTGSPGQQWVSPEQQRAAASRHPRDGSAGGWAVHRGGASTPPPSTAELDRDPNTSSLSKARFARFVAAVRSRLPIGDRVQWIDSPTTEAHETARVHSQLLDMTTTLSDREKEEQQLGEASDRESDLGPRRMFVQLVFDPTASAEQAWHLEIRWNMCQGHKVEDLVKYCMRRARQAGLLLLQVPTGRRPRPFSPPTLVPISPRLQQYALIELRTRLCFVRESTDAADDLHARRSSAAFGERWMHELGVAFVQRDTHGRGFLWTVNRLLPSQAGRSHSEKLLAQFREICERLEMDSAEQQQREDSLKERRQRLSREGCSGSELPPPGAGTDIADNMWDWAGAALGPLRRAQSVDSCQRAEQRP